MEFFIAGAVVIVLLALLGILFLPRREELKEEEKMLPLYPPRGERDRIRVIGRQGRSGGERERREPDL